MSRSESVQCVHAGWVGSLHPEPWESGHTNSQGRASASWQSMTSGSSLWLKNNDTNPDI